MNYRKVLLFGFYKERKNEINLDTFFMTIFKAAVFHHKERSWTASEGDMEITAGRYLESPEGRARLQGRRGEQQAEGPCLKLNMYCSM